MFWANCVEKVGNPKAYSEIGDCFTSNAQDMLSGPWLFDAGTHCSMQDEEGNTLRPFWTHQVQEGGESIALFIGDEQVGEVVTPSWFGE